MFSVEHTHFNTHRGNKMDLMEIMRNHARARTIIIEMNLAEISKAYGITLADARKVQHYAILLETA